MDNTDAPLGNSMLSIMRHRALVDFAIEGIGETAFMSIIWTNEGHLLYPFKVKCEDFVNY